MKVYAVGTGCTWYTRRNTSFILDDTMLFDISSGNYKEVIKQIDIFNLSAIFISHLHSDHFGDLNVITTRFIREAKRRNRLTKLRVYGQKGIAEHLIALNKLFFSAEDETDINLLKQYVDFIEVEDGSTFSECGYNITVYKMLHGKMECYGYSFTDDSGKTVSFSADTSLCDNLEKLLSVSNYAFVDMAGVTENPFHLHYENFAKLAEKYPHCTMFPVHVSDPSLVVALKHNLKVPSDGEEINL